MTASTVKSTNATNLALGGTSQASQSSTSQGRTSRFIDSATVATTSLDDTGDIVLLCPIPSNIRLAALALYNDDLDSSTGLTLDIGIANGADKFVDGSTSYAPFAPISAALFTSALADQSAITAGTNVVIANAVSHVDELNQPLWQRAGLAADPQRTFLVQVKVNHVATTPVAGRLVIVADGITGS